MDITTILGIVMGMAFVLITMLLGGTPALFMNAPSVMITVGGTVSAIVTAYTMKELTNIINVVKNTLSTSDESPNEIIALLVKFAERARREGILALEKQMEEVTDTFLKSGMQLAVDGTEPELLKDIMETELFYLEERHKKGHGQLQTFADLAPAWGMIGTLIGLILMLANLSDPDALGPGMAVALITTFYGSIMANMIFIPMTTKLKGKTQQELFIRQLMIQGILSIQSGDNPRIVEQKLNSFIAPKERVIGEE